MEPKPKKLREKGWCDCKGNEDGFCLVCHMNTRHSCICPHTPKEEVKEKKCICYEMEKFIEYKGTCSLCFRLPTPKEEGKEFPEGKEAYCPRCYFENGKNILRKDCPHNSPPKEEAKKENCPHCGYYCHGKSVFCNPPISTPKEEGKECKERGQHCFNKGTGHTCTVCCFCKFNSTPKDEGDWETIDEILFNLHIRFCPLVDSPKEVIRQEDCNSVKDELRSVIRQIEQRAKNQALEMVLESLPKERKFDGYVGEDSYENEARTDGFNKCLEEIRQIIKKLQK